MRKGALRLGGCVLAVALTYGACTQAQPLNEVSAGQCRSRPDNYIRYEGAKLAWIRTLHAALYPHESEPPVTWDQVVADRLYVHPRRGVVRIIRVDSTEGALVLRDLDRAGDLTLTNAGAQGILYTRVGTYEGRDAILSRMRAVHGSSVLPFIWGAFELRLRCPQIAASAQRALQTPLGVQLRRYETMLAAAGLVAPPDDPHPLPLLNRLPFFSRRIEEVEVVIKLLRDIYEETGEDLVHSGLISQLRVRNLPGRDDPTWPFIKGTVALDVDIYGRIAAWERGLPWLADAAGLDPLPQRQFALGTYRSESDTDATTNALRRFKSTGDIGEVTPLLQRSNVVIEDIVQQMRERYGVEPILVPVPNSERPLTRSVADFVAAQHGLTVADVLEKSSAVQDSRDLGLIERMLRAAAEPFAIRQGSAVPQTPVLLIDDVAATGVTATEVTSMLIEAGVPAVWSLALLKTLPPAALPFP